MRDGCSNVLNIPSESGERISKENTLCQSKPQGVTPSIPQDQVPHRTRGTAILRARWIPSDETNSPSIPAGKPHWAETNHRLAVIYEIDLRLFGKREIHFLCWVLRKSI